MDAQEERAKILAEVLASTGHASCKGCKPPHHTGGGTFSDTPAFWQAIHAEVDDRLRERLAGITEPVVVQADPSPVSSLSKPCWMCNGSKVVERKASWDEVEQLFPGKYANPTADYSIYDPCKECST